MPLAKGIDVRPEGARCDDCTLRECAFVGSEGPPGAALAIVGEAPGTQEVLYGRPFVGRAGQLLDRALQEAGLSRQDCLVTNATLCRPWPHRPPTAQEIGCCRARLVRELAGVRVVVATGNAALRAMAGRGQISQVRGVPVRLDALGATMVPTWHPAAVLRQPQLYRDLVNDLRLAADLLAGRGRSHPKLNRRLVKDDLAAGEMATALAALPMVAVDFETDFAGQPLCLGLGWWTAPGEVTVWTVPRSILLRPEAWASVLPRLRIVAHDAKNEAKLLWRLSLPICPGDCTLLLHYVCDERTGTHRLEKVVRQLYPDHPELERWASFKKLRSRLAELPEEEVYWYNAMDVYFTARAWHDLSQRVDEDGWRVYRTLLVPALLPLAVMEFIGVRVDRKLLGRLQEEFATRLQGLEQELCDLVGGSINPNSQKQVAKVLYEVLGLPDPSGRGSTDAEALKALEDLHPFAGKMLEYRRVKKMLSTYLVAISERLDPDDRLHGRFNLAGTTTGRLSSSEPNLQNIPKHKGAESKQVRDLFVATPGWTLVEVDLSQAELRVLGYYSRDANLLAAIRSGIDLHRATAMRVFGVPEDQVTKEMRSVAKTTNFCILYGGGPDKVVETVFKDLGIRLSRWEAQRVIDQWFEAFPSVREWIEGVKEEARRTGRVGTPLGRVRRWSIVNDDALREAVNHPIQSLASDITLLSLTRLFRVLDPRADRLLLTVHDSILLETRRDPQEVARQVREVMLQVAAEVVGDVPFEVEVSAGERWGSLEPLPAAQR